MYVEFTSMKPHSRVWIYHSKRKFTQNEKKIISAALAAFTSDWQAHGVPLVASYDIRLDQFIILAVDEEAHGASGCSIDGSVRVMKELEQQLGLGLFERTHASFVKDDGVITLPLHKLKETADAGEWNADTPAINTLVTTKGELEAGFVVPAIDTWLRRYLPSARISG